jgi:hypothetical protein
MFFYYYKKKIVLIREGLNILVGTDVPTSSIVKEVAIDLVATFNWNQHFFKLLQLLKHEIFLHFHY